MRSGQIVYALLRDWSEGQLGLRAMSLVYSTVLGFVPLLALTFAVLKSLGVHNAMEPALATLLEALGERRDAVTAQIIAFVDNINVEIIGITSVGLLIYLVLDMMRKIESAFNFIWDVPRGRSWSNRVSEYLFAIVVSPLLLFISISITTSVNTLYVARLLEGLAGGRFIVNGVTVVLPWVFMSLAFAFAYSFLPNTRVQFRSALIGGIVTTLVWKGMGAFFQGYLLNAARDSIYLAFATVIAVMILTYVGWLVALLGGDIAYYHQHPDQCRRGRTRPDLGIAQRGQVAMVVASAIFQRFEAGQPPLTREALANQLGINGALAEQALQTLHGAGLLAATGEEPPHYLPVTSVSHLGLPELWRQIRQSAAAPLSLDKTQAAVHQVAQFMEQVDAVVQRLPDDGALTGSSQPQDDRPPH